MRIEVWCLDMWLWRSDTMEDLNRRMMDTDDLIERSIEVGKLHG